MELRKLILKFIVFVVLITSTYYFAVWQLVQGQVDYFYNKFTHQAKSMVIGGSRAGDGIPPSVIQQNFDTDEIEYPILNYGFSHQISDYGPIYLNAIKQKIIKETTNGLFILDVSPAGLSILKNQSDDKNSILKDDTFLKDIHQFNKHPNWEYIRKMYSHSLYKGFQRSRRINAIRYSHSDGWQEVMKKNEFYETSEEEISKWHQQKLKETTSMMVYFKPSKTRLEYLNKTINYLKGFGQVYLVRVPISAEFLEVEQSFWPDFNNQVEAIATQNHVPYFDYSTYGNQYQSYDGSHLFGSSAKAFTQRLCDDIKSVQSYQKK